MEPQLVRFSSALNPFRVRVEQCINLQCECADVTFTLTAVPDTAEPTADATSLAIRVEPESWQEIDPPERSAAQQGIVREFLNDYPPTQRQIFQKRAQAKRQTFRRLREYRIDPREMKAGLLVSYSQIVSEEGSILNGGHSISFRISHAGREYLIDDQYCANPDCRCEEIHLFFLEYMNGAGSNEADLIEDRFRAKFSLRGKMEIEKSFGCTPEEARAIASAWQDRFGRDLSGLRWRYEKVKEIGRRSLPARRAPARHPEIVLATPASPGRNDPCPCGSGKKYKRCCGR